MLKEKTTNLEFLPWEIILLKWRRNTFSRQTQVGEICCQQTCLARTITRSSLKRRKIIWVRTWIYKKKVRASKKEKVKSEEKVIFFLTLNWSKRQQFIQSNSNSIFHYVCVCIYHIYIYVSIFTYKWNEWQLWYKDERRELGLFCYYRSPHHLWSGIVLFESVLRLVVSVNCKL